MGKEDAGIFYDPKASRWIGYQQGVGLFSCYMTQKRDPWDSSVVLILVALVEAPSSLTFAILPC